MTKKTSKKTSKKTASTAKKTTAKKTTKKKKEVIAESGVDRKKDLKWNERKVAVFTALKQLKAVSGATSSVSAKAVAKKASSKTLEISTKNVRHYCYHAKAAGLIEVAKMEGTKGYTFYLTAKGAKLDPKEELKKQNA